LLPLLSLAVKEEMNKSKSVIIIIIIIMIIPKQITLFRAKEKKLQIFFPSDIIVILLRPHRFDAFVMNSSLV